MALFEDFPKTRPSLPPSYEKIYTEYYRNNRMGRGPASRMAQWMEGWMHRRIAQDVQAGDSHGSTLEIGAGTLNHLPYEPHSAPYDIVEPFAALYEDSPLRSRIRNIFSDIQEIPHESKYDRILSIASFEHICNLPEVVARTGLLLNNGGGLRAAVPSEGTPLWRLGWKVTTGLEFKRKYGLDYGVVMKHEHVNTAREIEQILRHFYGNVSLKVFGVSRSLSLYQRYLCANPSITRCLDYLKSFPAPPAV